MNVSLGYTSSKLCQQCLRHHFVGQNIYLGTRLIMIFQCSCDLSMSLQKIRAYTVPAYMAFLEGIQRKVCKLTQQSSDHLNFFLALLLLL